MTTPRNRGAAPPALRLARRPRSSPDRATALGAVTALAAVAVLVKALTIGFAWLRFGRQPPHPADLLLALAADLLLAALAVLAVEGLAAASDAASAVPGDRSGLACLAGRVGFATLAIGALTLALLYLVSALVFWEWGDFAERSDIEMFWRCPTWASIRHYANAGRGLLLALGFLAVLVAADRLAGWLRPRTPRLAAPAALAALALAPLAWGPLRNPAAYETSSPLVLALASASAYEDGLAPAVAEPPPGSYVPPEPRGVPPEWEHLRGIARGRDVILVALESVRKANVSLYGYQRPTTPNLDRIARQGLVFQRAYVSHPRSCKALEAISLGASSPRGESYAWYPELVAGYPSFFDRLLTRGYRLAVELNHAGDADNFLPFLRAATGAALARAIDHADLTSAYGERARPGDTAGDDAVLVEDFVDWYAEQDGPVAALIWMLGAHHPYTATRKPFVERTDVDRYDNSIYSTDFALGQLVEELALVGKRPLLVVFGDHGEAFGERAGDVLRGKSFYDTTVRVPFVIAAPDLFPERVDVESRFTLEDVPATLLFLLGEDPAIGQSQVAFARPPNDRIYFSTVYGDYKLGILDEEDFKLIWRPARGTSAVFDTRNDPGERRNVAATIPRAEILARQRELAGWYYNQLRWLEQELPGTDPERARAYFERYPEVAASVFGRRPHGAWRHYVDHGRAEGRIW